MTIKHIVAFSGGKDSTAMLLRMIDLNFPIDEIIFADTTFEFPEMYEWINTIEELIPYKIIRLTPEITFDSWFYGKFTRGKRKGERRGMPLHKPLSCYWTYHSKIKPMEKHYGEGNVIYIGIAADEIKRTYAKKYKESNNEYLFPLVDWNWSESECLEYLEKKGLSHPLKHNTRSGCWMCPNQSVESLKNLYFKHPELWEKLKKYEADSSTGFRKNINLNELEVKFKNDDKK